MSAVASGSQARQLRAWLPGYSHGSNPPPPSSSNGCEGTFGLWGRGLSSRAKRLCLAGFVRVFKRLTEFGQLDLVGVELRRIDPRMTEQRPKHGHGAPALAKEPICEPRVEAGERRVTCAALRDDRLRPAPLPPPRLES
jgi:hypothetical protein